MELETVNKLYLELSQFATATTAKEKEQYHQGYADAMLKVQDTPPMVFDPATCEPNPYPSEPSQWRKYHGQIAWIYNPWSGTKRDASALGSDPFGSLVRAPDEALHTDVL